ncbi:MAG TPA: bifunctional UDP-3-O-[3-hydroxymyristoyl] N-acetylglucosamine deacetylase/3-hydroxyacyl-ACP dehydratase [bacterium]|nr:bifunctional UDP-3-O-[3-hydroxymyristoyl] N-acetylglucosamine deacetylase/3-hydroxyacyl-ACP dehydratase [bacterium]HOL48507.1 bifunctional UDP-3-O-[3-hydroxymyristoyl] N-acetylglucosamine deacetylase/3-hydroxyacyl-ACP dehydratase [bacterium]HPQ20004.1 bifunctional UDP-3-O-[3-hydroxymyristoyl] N-acetylglucosamine deacetylase/3-hydroxyacyl-ACP dehydratase [bacterium]
MQTTIKKEIVYSGSGLHTGKETKIIIKPAEADYGIKFIRKDLPEEPTIDTIVENVLDVERETSLGITNDVKVHTVEHLLSALYGMNVTNVKIEIYGEEVPVTDGSAKVWVDLIKESGIKELHKPAERYVVKEPIAVTKGDACLILLPYPGLKVSYTIDYPESIIGSQFKSLEITPEIYEKEICEAKTFGEKKDVDALKAAGLIKGGSLEVAVIADKDKYINPEKMKYPDDCVRHKILDLLGDISLLGVRINAHIIGIKAGHSTNINLINKVYQLYKRTYPALKKIYNIFENDDMIDINSIKKILPHRYPFLLIDRVIGIDGDKKIIGLKNVTINEPFFTGHFPEKAVMPGVLIIEAMAQMGGVLLLRKSENLGKTVYFMGLDNVKWRYPVVPGDQLIIEVETVRIGSMRGVLQGKAYVEGKCVAEAEMKFSIARE